MFQIPLDAFEEFPRCISKRIGRDVFCPEVYLLKNKKYNIEICGKNKVVISLHLLAGGLYLMPYKSNVILACDIDGALDSFNFPMSSCRIYIECAFGELVMRLEIFWRMICFHI